MDEFIVWAAGFFDGEGSISITRPRYRLQVSVANSNKPALELFAHHFAGAITLVSKAGKPAGLKYKSKVDTYSFSFTYKGAKAFLIAALPYLRVKKAEAEIVIDFLCTFDSLAPLRTGRGVAKAMIGLERKVRFQCYQRLKAIRKETALIPLSEPLVIPQPRLFSDN